MSESPSKTESKDDAGTSTGASTRSGLKRNRGSELCTGDSDSRTSNQTRTIHVPENEPAFALEEYTVGWVSALPLEMAAAKGMLDQVHPNLSEQNPADHNSYVLGQIQGHNVAIACLPAGIYGTTTAATVAKDMLRTFKSIRFGLMVGIGGGAPSSTQDVRLGDIVVGQPTGTSGGVIQHDRGKTVRDGEFQRTGSLNAPPQLLLSTLGRLQADHMSGGSSIPHFLSDLIEKIPKKMKKKFGYQGSSNDYLFRAEYEHVDPDSACDQCDRAQTIQRDARDDTDPVIHYGNIASGNQVIKHGKTRDHLSRELGVLCFEMEAAGLQDFPSLAIRGICDYADSHKNKIWQEYAAAAAAAFAKELLSAIPPGRVAQERPIQELVSITKDQLLVSTQHRDISSNHRDISSQQLSEHKLTNEILQSRPMDLPTVNEARFDSADVQGSPKCERGTRIRIRGTITQWAQEDSAEPLFWLVGPAGTGKSTIARTVAGSFHSKHQLSAGYFFKRGEQGRNDTNRLFPTLAIQLAESIPSFMECLRESLDNLDRDAVEKKGLEFQFNKLLWLPLAGLLSPDTSQLPRVIIIDALDECERPGHIAQVVGLLSKLCTITTIRLRVLFTSRSDRKIVAAFRPSLERKIVRRLELHREFREDSKSDIQTFLKTRFKDIRMKCDLTQDPWPAVDDLDRLVYLATSPEPLFIYAATLCRFVYDEKHPRDPRKQLKLWLKQGQENKSQLHQIYDSILTQVFPGDEEAGYGQQLQFLGALVLLATPLPVVSFSCLLGTDMDDINWWLPELHAVLDIPTEPYGPIRSLHKSFSDFLLSPVDQGAHKYRVDAADTHAMLTMKCIQRMQAGLKRDICNIQKLDASRDKIEQGNINKCIPSDL
ncbi:hypothetical protein F5883DRAFT_164287 [Diaporthe sp. PMI_573]|nr:hypothetical protein F5883DRAFT_164287 [Diaporthaceae sp. PMI_573]